MPKTARTTTLEAFCVGVTATKMDKRSMITGRVTTMKTTRRTSLLVELMRSRRVMMLILPC